MKQYFISIFTKEFCLYNNYLFRFKALFPELIYYLRRIFLYVLNFIYECGFVSQIASSFNRFPK